LNKIYSEFESKYFTYRIKLRKDFEKNKISQEDYNNKLSKTLKELEIEMNKAMQQKEDDIIADLNREVIHKVEKTGEGKIKLAYDKCPACKTELNENDFECPDCGLNLK
jgi:hypothetical protein